jgi:hypothetical protein
MVYDEEVKKAVRIFRHVPTTGERDFSPSDAMKWAGLPAELADTATYKSDFAGYRHHFEQKYGPPPYKDDDTSVGERFRYLWHNTVAQPDGTRKKTQALVMELAGVHKDYRGPCALYQRCSRLKDASKSGEALPVDIDPIYLNDDHGLNDSRRVSPLSEGSQGHESFGDLPRMIPQGREPLRPPALRESFVGEFPQMIPHQGHEPLPRPPALRRSLSLNGLSRQIMSPLSSTGFSDQSSPSPAVSHPSSTINNDMICISIPLDDALKDIVEVAVGERVAAALALEAESAAVSTCSGSRVPIGLRNKRQGMAKAVQRLTTVPDNRLTSKARQAQRQRDEMLRDIKSTGYKLGTLLLDCVNKKLAPLKHLDTRDKVAEAINGLFGVELVSGKSVHVFVKFQALVHPLTLVAFFCW